MSDLKGLATGIGSLPHKDPCGALDLLFASLPELPFWPQLPKRTKKEGMVEQFSEGLPCLGVNEGGIFFDPRDKEKKLEEFYAKVIAGEKGAFAISQDFAAGLYAFCERLKGDPARLRQAKALKGHVTGPFSFAAGINDDQGVSLMHDPVLMQAISKGLAMKALWQVDLLRQFKDRVILFIDEPYLGSFGSAYTPVTRQDVTGTLGEFTREIKSSGCLIGVHCCGNTDWSLFLEEESIDIVNFDAFGFTDKFLLYAESLQKFLERGGMVCWGIVPTQEQDTAISAGSLLERIKSAFSALEKKRVSRQLLCDNMLLSPSCGLGTLGVGEAEKIFSCLRELSSLARNTFK